MNLRKATILLFAVYAVTISYSVLAGFAGLPYPLWLTPLNTLLGFTFALLHAAQWLGWRRSLLLVGLTFAISLLFECVGVATGLVYGPYHYTERLGIKFLGLVPLLIPVAWFMMMYPSYVIATWLLPTRWKPAAWRLGVAVVGALVMTAWDVAMDPLMVLGGHWVWDVKGAFFGVPLQNYWGWWLTTFVTFALFAWLANQGVRSRPALDGMGLSFSRLALAGYALIGLSTVINSLRAGLGGSALAGLFAMLPWMMMAWMRSDAHTGG